MQPRTWVITVFDPADGEYVEIVRAASLAAARRAALAGRPRGFSVVGASADDTLPAPVYHPKSVPSVSPPRFPRQVLVAGAKEIMAVRTALNLSRRALAAELGITAAALSSDGALWLVPARREPRRRWAALLERCRGASLPL